MKNYILYPLEFTKYIFLRIFNFILLKIPENIFLYPTKLTFYTLLYYKKMFNLKSKYNCKISFSKILFPKDFINFGIIKSPVNSNWLINSKDKEISFLPRRLFWLIYELTNNKRSNKNYLFCYLNKFIYDFSEDISTNNFSPYILSECLSNLSLFNRSINKSWLIKDPSYINFIIKGNMLLVRKLEFRGPFSTCNHILNNFRGLYLSYHSILPANQNLFFVDFWERIKLQLFKNNTIIFEGSIHYHFLITRWLFELCICAYEIEDFRMLNLIQPYLKSHLKMVSWTSSLNSIPLFGDLSPDCPVDWLLPLSFYSNYDYPFENIGKVNKGWDKLWT